jgi:outer membrane protein OmpA-like peptidoglycan-associated protein
MNNEPSEIDELLDELLVDDADDGGQVEAGQDPEGAPEQPAAVAEPSEPEPLGYEPEPAGFVLQEPEPVAYEPEPDAYEAQESEPVAYEPEPDAYEAQESEPVGYEPEPVVYESQEPVREPRVPEVILAGGAASDGGQGVGRPRVALVGAGLVALLVVGALGAWLISRGDGSDGSEATATEDQSATDAATDDPAGADIDSVSQTDGSTDGTGDASAGEGEPFVVPPTPDNPNGVAHYTVIKDGKLYLRGWFPSPEAASDVVARAVALVGPDNVVDEIQYDPRAPELGPDFAIYLEDYVLFESNSAEVGPDFYPVLDMGVAFLTVNQDLKQRVVAYTDYLGSEADNLKLSEDRAQAVADYYIANGVSPDQVVIDPRGEEGAVEDADEEQAQQDRRVELILVPRDPEEG